MPTFGLTRERGREGDWKHAETGASMGGHRIKQEATTPSCPIDEGATRRHCSTPWSVWLARALRGVGGGLNTRRFYPRRRLYRIPIVDTRPSAPARRDTSGRDKPAPTQRQPAPSKQRKSRIARITNFRLQPRPFGTAALRYHVKGAADVARSNPQRLQGGFAIADLASPHVARLKTV